MACSFLASISVKITGYIATLLPNCYIFNAALYCSQLKALMLTVDIQAQETWQMRIVPLGESEEIFAYPR